MAAMTGQLVDERSDPERSHLHAYTLSVEDAAMVLEQPVAELWRRMRAGDLPHVRIRAHRSVEYRLLPEDVLDFYTRLRAEPGAPPEISPAAVQEVADAPVPDDADEERSALATLTALIAQATAPLAQTVEHLEQEQLRLRDLLGAQAESLVRACVERDRLQAQLDALAPTIQTLAAQVAALQEEVRTLRTQHHRETDQGYRSAWRQIQQRPWWIRVPDLG